MPLLTHFFCLPSRSILIAVWFMWPQAPIDNQTVYQPNRASMSFMQSAIQVNAVSYIERVSLFSAFNEMVENSCKSSYFVIAAVYFTRKCQEHLVPTFRRVIILRLMWNSPDISRFAEHVSEKRRRFSYFKVKLAFGLTFCTFCCVHFL